MNTAFLGISLDGYISPAEGQAAKFSSKTNLRDIRRHLGSYDAVVMGKATLDAYGTSLTPMCGKKIPQYIYTRNKDLDFSAYPKFQKQVSEHYTIQDLTTLPENTACLGGSVLVADMLRLGLLDYLHITISPILLGGGVKLDLPHTALDALCTSKYDSTDEVNIVYSIENSNHRKNFYEFHGVI